MPGPAHRIPATGDPGLAGQTITLTSHQLTISKSLEIQGLGADQLAISGNDTNRVFEIRAGTPSPSPA